MKIFKYVTKGTFDAYNWGLIENKQKFIGQMMSGKNPSRSCEDVDEATLSYAEVKALASGDPRIMEKTDLDGQVTKLKLLKANHESQRYALEDKLIKSFPQETELTEKSERLSVLNVALNIGDKDKPRDKEERQARDRKTSIKRLLHRMGMESAASSAAPRKEKDMETFRAFRVRIFIYTKVSTLRYN